MRACVRVCVRKWPSQVPARGKRVDGEKLRDRGCRFNEVADGDAADVESWEQCAGGGVVGLFDSVVVVVVMIVVLS